MREDDRRHAADPGADDQSLARATLERRRRRDAAAALPFAGLALFATPLIDLAAGGGPLMGFPLAAIYVFASWFALIALTARLASRLADDGPP